MSEVGFVTLTYFKTKIQVDIVDTQDSLIQLGLLVCHRVILCTKLYCDRTIKTQWYWHKKLVHTSDLCFLCTE